MSDYEEQWNRVKRWFERVERIENGVTNEPFDAAKFKDDYLAFFQNCYHLQDWLMKDDSTNITESDVDRFIDARTCMTICADLCNGSKHLELGSGGRSNEEPEMADGAIIRDNVSTGEISASYRVETNSGDEDAFNIAEECMDEWRQFLQNNNLI